MSTTDLSPPAAEPPGRRLEFETLISDTSASLVAAPPDHVELSIERALENVRSFFQADRCALLSVSADQQIVNVRLASYSAGVEPVPRDLNLAQAFPWSRQKLLVERAPVRVARIGDLPPEAHAEREAWVRMPIRSALTLPIETAGHVGHLIALNTVHEDREWPEAFVPRLRLLGEMLVGSLERHEHLAGLRHAERRLASGSDLAGLAYYDVDLGAGTAYVDSRFRDLCGVPPDRMSGLQPLEFWIEHLHPDDRPRVMEMRERLHDGRLSQVSVEYRFRNPSEGQRWVHHLARVASRDAAGRAILTFGVLRDVSAVRRTEHEFRDLSQRLILAHEEERAFLARELHDDLTQRLALLAIDVGRAELAATDGAQAATMRAVREGLVRLSEDVHDLAYHLHPSILDELGLAEALRAECERQEGQRGVAVTANLEPLPAGTGRGAALCLFRVAQEALNNATRHAGARRVSVVLRRMDGGLQLAVSDDGAGFDPAVARAGRSLGLASMRERVRLANGSVDVESAPGRGTSIVAWVPDTGDPE